MMFGMDTGEQSVALFIILISLIYIRAFYEY